MLHKQGEPILGEMDSNFYTRIHIPKIQLDRINVKYINVLDKFYDPLFNRTYQPESGQLITAKLWNNHVCVDCLMVQGQKQDNG